MNDGLPDSACSCCGQQRDPAFLATLGHHDNIKVCRACVGWLRGQTGTPDSTPIFPVRDMAEAVSFYESAGFEVHPYDGAFAFVHFDGESVFDLVLAEQTDPTTNGAGCYLIVPLVDEWRSQLVATGLPATAVEDQPWGMREFTVTDPSGNYVRIGRSI